MAPHESVHEGLVRGNLVKLALTELSDGGPSYMIFGKDAGKLHILCEHAMLQASKFDEQTQSFSIPVTEVEHHAQNGNLNQQYICNGIMEILPPRATTRAETTERFYAPYAELTFAGIPAQVRRVGNEGQLLEFKADGTHDALVAALRKAGVPGAKIGLAIDHEDGRYFLVEVPKQPVNPALIALHRALDTAANVTQPFRTAAGRC